MIGRVAGRVHGAHDRIARGNSITIVQRLPAYAPCGVVLRPQHLEETDVRHPLRYRCRAGRMVHMAVRDQHLREPRTGKGLLERFEMPQLAGAGVDQRWDPARNQPRCVTGSGHRSGIERVNRDRIHQDSHAGVDERPIASDRIR